MEAKTLKEYEEALRRAKEKAEEIIVESKDKADLIIKEAKDDAKVFFEQGKEELAKAQKQSSEIIQSAQDKALQAHKEGLKELEERKDHLDVSINGLLHPHLVMRYVTSPTETQSKRHLRH